MATTPPASQSRRLTQGLLIGLAGFVLAAAAAPRLLHTLELRTFDMRARRFAAPSAATDSIRLIFLDQATLDWGKQENGLSWPWMREAYVPLVEFCRRAGARSLSFDLLFTEPSAYGSPDDAALGAALARYGRTIQAVFHPHATPPIPEVAAPAALLGHVQAAFDSDGILRRVVPAAAADGRHLPMLGLAPLLLDSPGSNLTADADTLHVGTIRVPLDRKGRFLLRFRGPSQTHAAVNAKAVIQSELQIEAGEQPLLDPTFFRDKDVFFGATAHGLYDLRPTPMGEQYPGVEVQATLLDNLRAGDFLRTAPPAAAGTGMLLLCLLAGVAMRLCPTARRGLLVFALVAPIPLALAWTLYPRGWVVPAVAPEIGVLLALMGGMTANYAAEHRQKRFIQNAFRQYLSPVVIDQLVARPDKLRLGGEKKTLTLFFSDLQGFTSLSETLDPQALTALLNDYLTAVTAVLYEEGGTIDKYEGDAVIAFWNAPLEMPDHAARAVRAALRYQETLAAIGPRLRAQYGCDLVARIGLNSGPVVIGNMGSAQRFNYTFLGDAGNLASRLEGLNKLFGTPILVSQATRDLAGPAFAFRKIARVAVVGRREPVTVFHPMWPRQWEAGEPIFTAFDEALASFERGDFQAARTRLEPLAARDVVAARYLHQCDRLIQTPPTDWNGHWTLTEK